MVRLAISVEGQTEERFVKILIVPHLERFGIYTEVRLLNGHGGDVSLSRIKIDLTILAKSFDKVTTLYDFYGFKGKSKTETKTSLEEKIRDCIPPALQYKLIPYVQMYEFEGLLFSSPTIMEEVIQQKKLASWAISVLKKANNNPEQINDSPQTAPSKRLAGEIKNYTKTVNGVDIARATGLDILREKCVGFDTWLSTLEALNK